MEENITCKKIKQHSEREIGVTHTSQCTEVVYRDGLCKKHYTQALRKKTPWGKRPEYRVITLQEMQNGKHFKLRYSHLNKILRLRFGHIQQYVPATDSWEESSFAVDPESFCIKK